MPAPIALDLLAQFVAVAETTSFSLAARRLGVTKATVSRGIARLERELGVELVHRTTRRVALSTAGTALYERAAPALEALRQAAAGLPEREEKPSGELRITAPTDFGLAILPELVARFVARYPSVRLDARVTNRVVDLVAEGFDMAIRATGRPRDSSLTIRRLTRVGGRYYAAPAYLARRGEPRTVAEAGHTWIFPGMVPLAALGLPRGYRPELLGDDFVFIREAARHGAGIGLMPEFLAEPHVLAGELCRVLPTVHRDFGSFSLVYPSSGQVPRKLTAFRDFLVEALAVRQ